MHLHMDLFRKLLATLKKLICSISILINYPYSSCNFDTNIYIHLSFHLNNSKLGSAFLSAILLLCCCLQLIKPYLTTQQFQLGTYSTVMHFEISRTKMLSNSHTVFFFIIAYMCKIFLTPQCCLSCLILTCD